MTGSKEERELIKRVFKGNERLLTLVQATMLGFVPADEDKELLKSTFADEKVFAMMRARFLPEIQRDAKPGQMSDFWLGLDEMIFGHGESGVQQAVLGNLGAAELMEEGLAALRDPSKVPDVSYRPDLAVSDPYAVRLFARNKYIKNVSSVCATLWVIAEMDDEETPQDTAQRLQKDSTQ